MCKYIRTEIGIYEIDLSEEETNRCYFTTKGWVDKADVVGQSNNLENLLDAFLCENKLGQGICSRDFTELKRNALHNVWHQSLISGNTWDDLQYSFYGLIKQNHDLICMAKYNEDKKEWELI